MCVLPLLVLLLLLLSSLLPACATVCFGTTIHTHSTPYTQHNRQRQLMFTMCMEHTHQSDFECYRSKTLVERTFQNSKNRTKFRREKIREKNISRYAVLHRKLKSRITAFMFIQVVFLFLSVSVLCAILCAETNFENTKIE